MKPKYVSSNKIQSNDPLPFHFMDISYHNRFTFNKDDKPAHAFYKFLLQKTPQFKSHTEQSF